MSKSAKVVLGRVLLNPGSLNVRLAPKATELLRHRELSQRAHKETHALHKFRKGEQHLHLQHSREEPSTASGADMIIRRMKWCAVGDETEHRWQLKLPASQM